MSTIKAFIRVAAKRRLDADVAVRFRISDGRAVQLFYKSEIYVNPKVWDAKNECIKAKVLYGTSERTKFNNSVESMKALLRDAYDDAPNQGSLTSEEFAVLVDMKLHPERYEQPDDKKDFFTQFDKFLRLKESVKSTYCQYKVVYRCLQRFQIYKEIQLGNSYKLEFDSLDADLVREFENFLKNEHIYCTMPKYKRAYESVKEKRMPGQRGGNSLCNLLKKFRALVNWANNQGLTTNDPFRGYTIQGQIFGTPFYITREERNQIAEADLMALWESASDEVKKRIPKTHIPQLEVQRDVFVFQCLVGCRVGDLYSFTRDNVSGGELQYIAGKTKDDNPITINFELHPQAIEILSRYDDVQECNGKLFPLIAQQRYNDAIKDVFTLVGLNRLVTVRDSLTGKGIQRPINEVASSHMARRAFVGNLYELGINPATIRSMSGHSEGSRAFDRYHDISKSMKSDAISKL